MTIVKKKTLVNHDVDREIRYSRKKSFGVQR